jgi:hypothetical protein
MENYHISGQLLPIEDIAHKSSSKITREKEINSLIDKWFQLNSDKNLQHIVMQIVKLCIWMELHRIKMDVYYNCRNIGTLNIFYDGSLKYENWQTYFQPYMTHDTFMGTKFKWLPDVIGWTDCNKILTPKEGARYINYANNTMASLNIFEYYQGKWIKTIPEKGLLIYQTDSKSCSYYDGSCWNGCFNISKD